MGTEYENIDGYEDDELGIENNLDETRPAPAMAPSPLDASSTESEHDILSKVLAALLGVAIISLIAVSAYLYFTLEELKQDVSRNSVDVDVITTNLGLQAALQSDLQSSVDSIAVNLNSLMSQTPEPTLTPVSDEHIQELAVAVVVQVLAEQQTQVALTPTATATVEPTEAVEVVEATEETEEAEVEAVISSPTVEATVVAPIQQPTVEETVGMEVQEVATEVTEEVTVEPTKVIQPTVEETDFPDEATAEPEVTEAPEPEIIETQESESTGTSVDGDTSPTPPGPMPTMTTPFGNGIDLSEYVNCPEGSEPWDDGDELPDFSVLGGEWTGFEIDNENTAINDCLSVASKEGIPDSFAVATFIEGRWTVGSYFNIGRSDVKYHSSIFHSPNAEGAGNSFFLVLLQREDGSFLHVKHVSLRASVSGSQNIDLRNLDISAEQISFQVISKNTWNELYLWGGELSAFYLKEDGRFGPLQ